MKPSPVWHMLAQAQPCDTGRALRLKHPHSTMPLSPRQAMGVWNLATRIRKYSCTIPRQHSELRFDDKNGHLWIAAVAYACRLATGELAGRMEEGRLHLTILTAEGIKEAPSVELLLWAEEKLQTDLEERVLEVAGEPEPIMDPILDLPHRAILTINVNTRLHSALSTVRNRIIQQARIQNPDRRRVNYHLSVDWLPAVARPNF